MSEPDREGLFTPNSRRMMRSRSRPDHPGRYQSIDHADLDAQRAKGWTDFHPEDFCHRCGHPNVSWYIDSLTWNQVMRGGDEWAWGAWAEIICIPCFIELAELHYGGGVWRVVRDEAGTEVLILVQAGAS